MKLGIVRAGNSACLGKRVIAGNNPLSTLDVRGRGALYEIVVNTSRADGLVCLLMCYSLPPPYIDIQKYPNKELRRENR
jgi:hypothetical protein